jgi:hypothetical protein
MFQVQFARILMCERLHRKLKYISLLGIFGRRVLGRQVNALILDYCLAFGVTTVTDKRSEDRNCVSLRRLQKCPGGEMKIRLKPPECGSW